MYEIELQLPGVSLGEIQDFAKTFGCEAHKTKFRTFYRITADDPIQFYWLGCNINNHLLNQMNIGGSLSKFVEL